MSRRQALRPVVALDIDGVLNAAEGGVEHTITIPAEDLPNSPFLRGHGSEVLTLTLHLDPALGPWISALREIADVVWATTWEDAANVYLAPLLGIDPIPVAVSVAADLQPYWSVADVVTWKADALNRAYAGRVLVWLDDLAAVYRPRAGDITRVGRTWWDWRTDRLGDRSHAAVPTLVIAPDPTVGLTAEHRAVVDRFLTDPWGLQHPTSAEGRRDE